MYITEMRIKNLRSFSNVTVPFNRYTCLVGPNGSGKSTILCALNIFFREASNSSTDVVRLDREDFHQKNTENPIEITVTFEGLEADAQKEFADYFRQGKLIISAIATFNPIDNKAEVKQYGQRLGLSDFAPFFQAVGDGKKVSELKDIYISIRRQFNDLPSPGSKDAMIDALRKYEAAHEKDHSLLQSEDQFYGVSKGANRLAKYIQWVYVPAVKDASTEQIEARNTALGKLLARTVRAKTNFEEDVLKLRAAMQQQYQGLLDQNQSALKELSSSLKTRLSEWAHPDASIKLEWQQDPEKSVRVEEPLARIIAGEGNFEGDLARFGHGLQRSYLLALLHELATSDDANAPRLILGCEEPELYQHPPQARHLATVLTKLSEANSQIIASTHSPFFVSGEGFEDVRMVRKEPARKCSNIHYMTYQDVSQAIATANGEKPWKPEGALAKIHQALQPSLSEMFFATRLILVEGLEDIAYLTTYLHLLGLWDNYRRAGCHLIACNGKSEILQTLVIAKGLGIPTKIIFDSDADKEDRNGSRAKHLKDNKGLLAAVGKAHENPLPKFTFRSPGCTMWHSDIGAIIRGDIGAQDWQKFQSAADAKYGHSGGLKKNSLHVGASLAFAWESGKRSPNLDITCRAIVDPDDRVPF